MLLCLGLDCEGVEAFFGRVEEEEDGDAVGGRLHNLGRERFFGDNLAVEEYLVLDAWARGIIEADCAGGVDEEFGGAWSVLNRLRHTDGSERVAERFLEARIAQVEIEFLGVICDCPC